MTDQPQAQQQSQEPLENETLKYLGKTLKSEGQKKDGTPWKSFKLHFQSSGQYPFTCGAFDKISDKGVQVSQLVEGQYYTIVYKRTHFDSQYGPKVGREAVLIKTATPEQSTENRPRQVSPVPSGPAVPITGVGRLVAKDWVNFAAEYDTATKDNPARNSLHMLGAYIANKYDNECNDLIVLCKKHFTTAVVEVKKPLEV